MNWTDNVLKVSGEPRGSVRPIGDRWIGFAHEKHGAKIVGYYSTADDARDAVARAVEARLRLSVTI